MLDVWVLAVLLGLLSICVGTVIYFAVVQHQKNGAAELRRQTTAMHQHATLVNALADRTAKHKTVGTSLNVVDQTQLEFQEKAVLPLAGSRESFLTTLDADSHVHVLQDMAFHNFPSPDWPMTFTSENFDLGVSAVALGRHVAGGNRISCVCFVRHLTLRTAGTSVALGTPQVQFHDKTFDGGVNFTWTASPAPSKCYTSNLTVSVNGDGSLTVFNPVVGTHAPQDLVFQVSFDLDLTHQVGHDWNERDCDPHCL
jgi:hypothetical protein